MTKSSKQNLKPIMKWAGGKAQMLKDILPTIPTYTGKYIEPFFGGGALFFALQPDNAVIADSNPEFINVYVQVANDVEGVISKLQEYENTEEMFYAVRALDWESLTASEAAARTLYLNKTCFNGLYRVNRKGQFNTPFGRYKNPTICDEKLLRAASDLLKFRYIFGKLNGLLHTAEFQLRWKSRQTAIRIR
ncbi:DNA adenine methylase [Butyrivibrio sp.]|uniref:DNA adenine methylase n=1 Tax=Butyrivibrio sp. TaxID=28121 RepID=UPI0025C35A26|nr:Dam family site-specific DNA-(adenine-N6)-methyltransferase [Butyrivibrio sp.]